MIDDLKLESFIKEYKKRDELERDFIINQGCGAIEEIIKEVNQSVSLNESDINYGTLETRLSLSSVEMGYMLSAMMEYATNHVGNPVDEECEFENKLAYFEYEGEIIQIFEMYGQGTVSWFTKPNEETVKKLKNTAYGVYLIQFDDFINHYKKR
ncbi:hypothetical protein [Bacillus altitudinis]